jgi:TatA/E family protein of Tat protein translocase
MFGTLGGPELLLILVLALIVFGPRKLPEVGRSMGKMLAEFRKASHEFQRTIEDEVEAEKSRSSLPARRRRGCGDPGPGRGHRRPRHLAGSDRAQVGT